MDLFDILQLAGGVILAVGYIPQIAQIIHTKSLSLIHISTEQDVMALAYSLILKRVTAIVLAEYPEARWVWEAPNAPRLIELGEDVFILLNRAGGYRRAKVVIRSLKVIGIQYQEAPAQKDEPAELSLIHILLIAGKFSSSMATARKQVPSGRASLIEGYTSNLSDSF